jgi:hypothetical protein
MILFAKTDNENVHVIAAPIWDQLEDLAELQGVWAIVDLTIS